MDGVAPLIKSLSDINISLQNHHLHSSEKEGRKYLYLNSNNLPQLESAQKGSGLKKASIKDLVKLGEKAFAELSKTAFDPQRSVQDQTEAKNRLQQLRTAYQGIRDHAGQINKTSSFNLVGRIKHKLSIEKMDVLIKKTSSPMLKPTLDLASLKAADAITSSIKESSKLTNVRPQSKEGVAEKFGFKDLQKEMKNFRNGISEISKKLPNIEAAVKEIEAHIESQNLTSAADILFQLKENISKNNFDEVKKNVAELGNFSQLQQLPQLKNLIRSLPDPKDVGKLAQTLAEFASTEKTFLQGLNPVAKFMDANPTLFPADVQLAFKQLQTLARSLESSLDVKETDLLKRNTLLVNSLKGFFGNDETRAYLGNALAVVSRSQASKMDDIDNLKNIIKKLNQSITPKDDKDISKSFIKDVNSKINKFQAELEKLNSEKSAKTKEMESAWDAFKKENGIQDSSTLSSILITPVQRGPRYQLLMQEIAKSAHGNEKEIVNDLLDSWKKEMETFGSSKGSASSSPKSVSPSNSLRSSVNSSN